jgi:2-aminoethylphosphonate-pyruvate transaminase
MMLLIPGPVMTRPEVRAALARDHAPWDHGFADMYASVQARIGALAGAVSGTHVTLPLQGCGHYACEAAVRTLLPPGGRILIPGTGAYADRMTRLAREAGRQVVPLPVPERGRVQASDVAQALAADSGVTHVGLVYSETGSGVIHDAIGIGAVVRQAGRRMILDAVSAFGALPLDMGAQPEIDAVVFSINKALEAPPGISFAVARIDALEKGRGQAGSWSLDLTDLMDHQRRARPGFSRFTPAAQVIGALDVALDLHAAEGREARLARYTANMRTLYHGVGSLGLTPYLPEEVQGPVVVNVYAPDDPAWNLLAFVDALKARGVLISNFYNIASPSFRVGCIGAVTPEDMRMAVEAMDSALADIGIIHRAARRAA